MANLKIYAYFKPNTLATSGYVYGTAVSPSSDQEGVSVSRVPSGRWSSLDTFECTRTVAELRQRSVSEEEALCGIGTYVGSCVCVARVSDRFPKAWDYGVVTGYTWFQDRLTGELHVCFGSESGNLLFNPAELQDLAVPSYALRPCYRVPVADVMPAEMRQRHSDALDHFTGSGPRATRSSSAILRKLGAAEVEESHIIPLFDVAAGKVEFVSIKYALDFSYYSDGGRRAPTRVRLGNTVFDDPGTNTVDSGSGSNDTENPLFMSGQLSNSDDSDSDVGSVPPPPGGLSAAAAAPQARRRERSAPDGVDEDLRSLKQLRTSYADNESMLRSIDQVIAFRESPLSLGSSSRMVSHGTTISNKAQYQPSSLKRVIHSQLVNGTYAPIEPMLLFETLQIQHESFAFLPHPAILRAFYSWDFGLRGLSVMHFAPVVGGSKRASAHNMTDFSKSASLPVAAQPQDLGAIIDAVDGLAIVVATVYLPYVVELVNSARKFIVSLKAREGFSTAEAKSELVHWVNERFERVRGFLALRELNKAQQVCSEFSFAEPSFVRVMQIITEVRMTALQSTHSTHVPNNHVTMVASSNSRHAKGKPPAQLRPPVPQDVLEALPTMNGQRLSDKKVAPHGKEAILHQQRCPVSCLILFQSTTGGFGKSSRRLCEKSQIDEVAGACLVAGARSGSQESHLRRRTQCHPYRCGLKTFYRDRGAREVLVALAAMLLTMKKINKARGGAIGPIGTSDILPLDCGSGWVGADVAASLCIGKNHESISAASDSKLNRCGRSKSATRFPANNMAEGDGYVSPGRSAQANDMITHGLVQYLLHQQRAYSQTLAAQHRLLSFSRDQNSSELREALSGFGLLLPKQPSPAFTMVDGQQKHWIDSKKQRVFSAFLRKSRMQLPQFVRLLRGESTHDSRPNKALEIPSNSPAWSSYRYRHEWEDIVRHGVRPHWKNSFQVQHKPPKNHASAHMAMNSLIKQIRKGQDAGQYLVLDIDLLSALDNITCKGCSVNDNTVDNDLVAVVYDGAHDLAKRILEVEQQFPGITKMMSGDVAGAFRYLAINADHVGQFAGTIPELGILIIDLCCPFGWALSPQHYWTAGAAINHLYASFSPKWPYQPSEGAHNFESKTWCDDHNLIEPDIGSRLPEANLALRRSMTSILGPEAVNEDKFTSWKNEGKMLGLTWNIPRSTLSMPPEKYRRL